MTARPPDDNPWIESTFALTFDTELIWGSFDHISPRRFEQQFPDVRGTIEAMIGVLDRHEVSATWAVVGHLFLDSCERDADGRAHPELSATRQSRWPRDWYSEDPCTDLSRDPLWYGTDILDMLQAASTPQEIGCHSFGHPVYGDHAFSREAAAADLRACANLATARGIDLRSFVFPRNAEGHHAALQQAGFTAFRGTDPAARSHLPKPVRRGRHFAEQAIGSAPTVSQPTERLPGLWDIKASMLLMGRTGVRRLISRQARLRRVRAGLVAARSMGGVFHVWTHPYNIAADRAALIPWLEDVVLEAARMRDRDGLQIDTMTRIAERAEAAKAGGSVRDGTEVREATHRPQYR